MNTYLLLVLIVICWTLQPFFKKVPLKKISSSEFYILNHLIYSIPIFLYVIYMLYGNKFKFMNKLDKKDYIYLILVVFVGLIGGLVFAELLKNNNASYVIPHVQPLIIVSTLITGYYVFNETINYKHIIGTILVIGGLVMINHGNKK